MILLLLLLHATLLLLLINNIIKDFHLKEMTISSVIQLGLNTEYNSTFSLAELFRTIESLNPKSVIRIDNLHNKFLLNFPYINY